MDLASIGAAAAAIRNRIPAGYPGSYAYAEKELAAPSPAQPSTTPPPGPAPAPAAAEPPAESKPQ